MLLNYLRHLLPRGVLCCHCYAANLRAASTTGACLFTIRTNSSALSADPRMVFVSAKTIEQEYFYLSGSRWPVTDEPSARSVEFPVVGPTAAPVRSDPS